MTNACRSYILLHPVCKALKQHLSGMVPLSLITQHLRYHYSITYPYKFNNLKIMNNKEIILLHYVFF